MPVPTLRADLLAARIFSRVVDVYENRVDMANLAGLCVDAARVLVAELEHYDGQTGVLKNAGLPADVDEPSTHEWQAPTW